MTRHGQPLNRSQQRGVSLFIALVALTTMTLAGIALMRSMDTATLLAGNFAYRQATVQAAEIAIEDATTFLRSKDSLWLNQYDDLASGNRYFRRMLATNPRGVPEIDWNNAYQLTNPPSLPDAFSIHYVIDRLCDAKLVQAAHQQCVAGMDGAVNYRITVKVSGPRFSSGWVQVVYRR